MEIHEMASTMQNLKPVIFISRDWLFIVEKNMNALVHVNQENHEWFNT